VGCGRGVVILAAVACASTQQGRPRLEASGPLTSDLPAEARLHVDESPETAQGRKLSFSLRVAHNAAQPMADLKLLSCTGRLEVSDGTGRRSYAIAPRASSPLPARFQLAWIGSRHDGSDKQPAYFEYLFESVVLEGMAPTAVEYELSAVVEWRGRQVVVSGRGRALRGNWRGSYPPSTDEAATRF